MNDLTKEQRIKIVENLGLTVDSTFVPFSQSRNAKEKQPSLNWRITVKRDGREVLTTDYSAGCGHAPAYKKSVRELGHAASVMRDTAIRWECERGYAGHHSDRNLPAQAYGKPLMPDTLDVLASLAMDSDVLDAGGFEEWAQDLGYDTDSRKAEQTYRACLEIALKLRAALGDDGLNDLRNAFQGY